MRSISERVQKVQVVQIVKGWEQIVLRTDEIPRNTAFLRYMLNGLDGLN
jgi:hypothetical protein